MLIDCLEAFGFPRDQIYVSFSGGKGYHVEIFFDNLVATEQLAQMYRWVVTKGAFDPHKVEFRPTNTMAIKLPLSIHARTGNMCWYVNRETLAPIERAEYIMEIEPIPASMLPQLIAANIRDETPYEILPVAASTKEKGGGKSSEQTRNLGTTLMEEGTRHNIMRNIAVHARHQGITEDQCRQRLLTWYDEQDKTHIRSTPEVVLADIEELISWVYSDRFELNYAYPKSEVTISETDSRLILSQRSRSARRIVFFLLARCKARQFKINYHAIAKAIHVSVKTTTKTILRLEQEGVLEIERGNRYSLGDGEFAAESNSYSVPYERGGKYERQKEIRIKDLMNDTASCYFETMLALLSVREVEQTLLREERDEYAAYKKQVWEQKSRARRERSKRQTIQKNERVVGIHEDERIQAD